jgi:aspartate/methionine/tyrosine aminotransferase
MARLGTETAFEVLGLIRKLESQGKDIVSFAIGEPGFDTPNHIKEAAIDALKRGYTKYTPSAGVMPLREAIAEDVAKSRGIPVLPEEVVVAPGAKPFIFHCMWALVEEGDEVIYPNPGFPIYESMINFVGGKPVPLPLVEEREFSFDLEQLKASVTPKTRLIILNSPQNPTGGVLTRQDLEAVAELAIKRDLWVYSDEVYSRIIYDGEFHSIASLPGMKERTILVDGFSKTYAMTGWRMGYGVMQRELAEGVARLITNSDSCTAQFTQMAGIAALKDSQEPSEAMVREYRKRRDLTVAGLNDIKGCRCLSPRGAFYVFPNVTQACRNLRLKDAVELQDYLLDQGVAVLARIYFGSRNVGETEEYIRLSYVGSEETINEGLRRIKKAIEGKGS